MNRHPPFVPWLIVLISLVCLAVLALPAAAVDSTSGSPKVCVQLSWDGGTPWTTAKTTGNWATAEASYTVGGAADPWGRTWNAAELGDSTLRVRLIPIASSTAHDVSLELPS